MRVINLLAGCMLVLGLCACNRFSVGSNKDKDFAPVVKFLDINKGETAQVKLSNGKTATVKLLNETEERDPALLGIWRSTVTVEVNGEQADLVCGVYNLPKLVGGVQIDCTATKNYVPDAQTNYWEIYKDARLRLWPAGAKWVEPGTFTPPLQERMFAGSNWHGNILMSGRPGGKYYYHAGMDTGGVEKLVPVVAATDGLLVQLGDAHLDIKDHPPIQPRYDVIYIRDGRGWYYRYSHLSSIEPSLKLGQRVKMGQRLGYVGKEGESGGWTHLHFELKTLTPDGKYGTQDAYVYWLQSYIDKYHPAVIAVAQPRRSALVGEEMLLDASRSWSKKKIAECEWTLHDGTKVKGMKVPYTYQSAGGYREILKVTDVDGNFAYDVMIVNVVAEKTKPMPRGQRRPAGQTASQQAERARGAGNASVQAFFYPTLDIKPGDPVYFSSRGNGGDGYDVYDFDDGTTTVHVRSNIDPAEHAENGYAMTIHHFKEARYYFVKVTRTDPETGKSGYHVMVVPVGIKP